MSNMRYTTSKNTRLQFVVILLCFIMNMCDGMDVMIVSYAANIISSQWQISAADFGVVFSAGLLGMAGGAILLAPIADEVGRKTLGLASLIVMGTVSIATGFVTSLGWLIVLRLVTGLAIGSMLACVNTLTAEYSAPKTRHFWVSFVGSGYPAGAVLSGFMAEPILRHYGWQNLFFITGAVILLVVPFGVLFLKESVDFLLKKQPKNDLIRVNDILSAMGRETIRKLPAKDVDIKTLKISYLFANGLWKSTLLLWFSFLLCFSTLYFLLSWIPRLAVDFGMSDSLAIYAGLLFNLGSWLGILLVGYLSTKLQITRIISAFLITSSVLMGVFVVTDSSLASLFLFTVIGFTMHGGFVGLYPVATALYETTIRSTGVGWAIGVGRLGAIIGPFVGGLLIHNNLSTSFSFLAFAVPSVIAGVMILFVKVK